MTVKAFVIQPHLKEITQLRHALHMQPELPGEERLTAGVIENFLRKYPPQQLHTHLGGYGLAAVYDSGEPGPTVLIRSDMDALPIHEFNEVVYKSTHNGISHKCGHDGHMAMVSGLAPLLYKNPPKKGRVVLLYQPSEETGEGAKRVIDDSRFASFRPDYCFALHNLPGFEQGKVVVLDDVFAAASVGLMVELKGFTSHAAYPEEGRSPALAMAKLIEGLETLNTDFDSKGHFFKVTVVSASLGENSFGITPGSANIMATLRAFDDDALDALQKKAESLTKQLAQQYKLQHHCLWNEYFPVTRNAKEASDRIRAAAQPIAEILAPAEPFRWSEDFGWFTKEAKGALFGLGSGLDLALHSATYDFPDVLLPVGTEVFFNILKPLVY